MAGAVDLTALGDAAPPHDRLEAVAREALGDPDAVVVSATGGPTGFTATSIATGGLYRVTGTAATARGERPWSAFVKVLHHPRHWPLIDLVPPAAAAEIKALFPWRDELHVREQVLPVLPPGLRVPAQYAVEELGDDRLAWWMEDIDADDDPWCDEDYARAAHLLARLAARRTPDQPAGACSLPPGLAVRKVVESRGPLVDGLVADDALWSGPLVAEVVDADYRSDLRRALTRLPDLLAEMDALPGALPHGDAAPANLLRPRGEPGTLVAIDWAFGCELPLGHDLGQLLVGEVEGGRADPAELPHLLDLVLRAYVDGLAEEGVELDPATVLRGAVCSSLGPRTLPGAYPLERLSGYDADDPRDRDLLRRRAGLGRWVLDLVLA